MGHWLYVHQIPPYTLERPQWATKGEPDWELVEQYFPLLAKRFDAALIVPNTVMKLTEKGTHTVETTGIKAFYFIDGIVPYLNKRCYVMYVPKELR